MTEPSLSDVKISRIVFYACAHPGQNLLELLRINLQKEVYTNQPELNYAAEIYSGATTVDILNCEAYWSPTNAQFATLQSWAQANTPANAISDDSWSNPSNPSSVGAPKLWLDEPKQAVIKGSIKINARTDSDNYNGAPAFVLFREAPSVTAPAVITIP